MPKRELTQRDIQTKKLVLSLIIILQLLLLGDGGWAVAVRRGAARQDQRCNGAPWATVDDLLLIFLVRST